MRISFMRRMKAILTFTAALAFALSPLASGGFGGFDAGRFPVPQTDPPIQPAGWAFSIWLPIYLWLIAGAGYGLLKRAEDPGWDRTRWPLLASLVPGAAWIPVAQMSPLWSTVLIWIMLGAALLALLRAPAADRPWNAAPTGLYAGWLTAAACVASGVLATGYGATPVLPVHAAFILLALGIGLLILRRRAAPAYAAGLGWALIGIVAANLAPPVWPIVLLAGAGLVLLAPLGLRTA